MSGANTFIYWKEEAERLRSINADLLAALVALCEGGSLPDMYDKRWAQANAAIDKARGKDSTEQG